MVANGKKVSCTAAIPTFRIIADICKGGATVCEKTLFDTETLTGRWGISEQFLFSRQTSTLFLSLFCICVNS